MSKALAKINKINRVIHDSTQVTSVFIDYVTESNFFQLTVSMDELAFANVFIWKSVRIIAKFQ